MKNLANVWLVLALINSAFLYCLLYGWTRNIEED